MFCGIMLCLKHKRRHDAVLVWMVSVAPSQYKGKKMKTIHPRNDDVTFVIPDKTGLVALADTNA